MVEIDQFEEAERLLERVTKCNGLCNNMCSDSVNVSNCGCKWIDVDVILFQNSWNLKLKINR